MTTIGPGTLEWTTATAAPHLLAAPVAAALRPWASAPAVLAAPIDPQVADTAAFCERYDLLLADSANCVIIAGRRGDDVRYAACLVLATTRADVNGVVRRRLDARKASFAPMEDATQLSGMEYGGITPIGLPADWPVLVDRAVLSRDVIIIGSGLRSSKIALPAGLVESLPGAEIVDGLAS